MIQIKNSSGRGVGGAHISVHGRPHICCAPEGDGNGAGAAGGETTATTTVAATTGDPAPAPGAASEKMLPQSQVSTLIATAKREAREAARKEFEALQSQATTTTPKKDAPPNGSAPPSVSATDVQQIIARERAIERASTGLTSSRATRMEEACRAANPSDVAAWCKSYREDMGFDAQTTATTAAPAAPAATAARPPPASDRGSPAATVPPIERDLVTMSDSDRTALIKEKGLAWYRSQLASQLKGRPISLR